MRYALCRHAIERCRIVDRRQLVLRDKPVREIFVHTKSISRVVKACKRCMNDLGSEPSDLATQEAKFSAWPRPHLGPKSTAERQLATSSWPTPRARLSRRARLPSCFINRAHNHPTKASGRAGCVRVRSTCVGIISRRSGSQVRAVSDPFDFCRWSPATRRIRIRILHLVFARDWGPRS